MWVNFGAAMCNRSRIALSSLEGGLSIRGKLRFDKKRVLGLRVEKKRAAVRLPVSIFCVLSSFQWVCREPNRTEVLTRVS
jgi:hypothetical protein